MRDKIFKTITRVASELALDIIEDIDPGELTMKEVEDTFLWIIQGNFVPLNQDTLTSIKNTILSAEQIFDKKNKELSKRIRNLKLEDFYYDTAGIIKIK